MYLPRLTNFTIKTVVIYVNCFSVLDSHFFFLCNKSNVGGAMEILESLLPGKCVFSHPVFVANDLSLCCNCYPLQVVRTILHKISTTEEYFFIYGIKIPLAVLAFHDHEFDK